MKATCSDLPVFRHLSVFMQRVSDYARRGYIQHTGGTVTFARLSALVSKFEHLYGCTASRYRRGIQRRSGGANAILLLYIPNKTQLSPESSVQWLLMFTAGQTPATKLENLKDASQRKSRVRLWHFELLRLPREGSQAPVWTWRIEEATYKAMRSTLIAAARRSEDALRDELQRIEQSPGFSGVRYQLKTLFRLASAENQRAGREPIKMRRPRYVQRLENGPDTVLGLIRSVRYTTLSNRVTPTPG